MADLRHWYGLYDWYVNASIWLRVALLPIIAPIAILHGLIEVLFLAPCRGIHMGWWLVQSHLANRRFWNWLRERHQLALWEELKSRLTSGNGMLIMEITMKGFSTSWWIDRPRDLIDKEHVLITFTELLQEGDFFTFPEARWDAMERWAMDNLGPFEMSALAVTPSFEEILALDEETKNRSIVVLFFAFKGALGSRLWNQFQTVQQANNDQR